jgi:hypothetical protein
LRLLPFQVVVMQKRVGERFTPMEGGVARGVRNMGMMQVSTPIQIIYDAELRDLPMCETLDLLCYFCSFYDKSRSYLYIRENSIESNVAFKCCCGLVGEQDSVSVMYFDRKPFKRTCCENDPKIDVAGFGCCCGMMSADMCCQDKVVIMPSENVRHIVGDSHNA